LNNPRNLFIFFKEFSDKLTPPPFLLVIFSDGFLYLGAQKNWHKNPLISLVSKQK
jgi:hypothetical protein